jgi:hypothetical protein
MDAALGFRLRHPLHAVPARFEFEPRIGATAFRPAAITSRKPPRSDSLRGDNIHLPALALRITAYTCVTDRRQTAPTRHPRCRHGFRETGCLIVVGVSGQQRALQLDLKSFHFGTGRLLDRPSPPVPSFPGRRASRPRRASSALALHGTQGYSSYHRQDVGTLAGELAIGIHVACGLLAAEQAVDFGEAFAEAFEFFEDAGFHCLRCRCPD